MRTRQRESLVGLLFLALQLHEVGVNNIPPVTLAVLALNVYLFIFPLAPVMQTCLSVQTAYVSKEWRRLLLSPLHHVNDWHLYFNMASFIYKGIKLEQRLGRAWFIYLLCVFSLLSGLVYLALEGLLTELTQDESFSMACGVGFSDVLFALKVLINHYYPGGVTYIVGFPVPNRYSSWVELVLIHIIMPGSSFIGHLSGILVGLLYTVGPLKRIMEKCADFASADGHHYRPRRYYRLSGFSGRSAEFPEYNQYEPDPTTDNTESYTGGLTEEEQLEAAIIDSLNESGQNSPGEAPPPNVSGEPSVEELRMRRLRRLDRTSGQRRGQRFR